MRFFSALASFLFIAVQGLPPLIGPLIPDNTGVVTGIVRRADTSRPVFEAQVALMKPNETLAQAMAHAAVTDVNGRFTFRNVPEGEYQVVAQAEGFFKPADDTPSTTWVAKAITVQEGQQFGGILLELIPGATISGRVESIDGQRAAVAPVEALQASYANGRLSLREVKATSTDDLGEYRLFGIPAGDYYVRAHYRSPSADRPERYAPIYFPGIADEDLAPAVSVNPAAEASAIDVRVPTTPIGGVTISGQVTDMELTERIVTAVYVVPRDRSATLVSDTSDAFWNEASDQMDGQFIIREVPAGKYNLFPIVKDSDGNLRMARIAVNVEDKSIEGLSAALTPAVELTGRVTLDGKTPLDESTKYEVVLTSLDGLPGILLNASIPDKAMPQAAAAGAAVAASAARVEPRTGEFMFPRVNPGQYSILLATPFEVPDAPDAYLADVRQKDKSVFDGGFVVGEEPPEPLVLTIRSQGGTISGTVFDETRIRPFARATVALVPDDPHRSNFTLYRTAVSLPNGSFNLTGVAPGSYKLFSWQTVTVGAWVNAGFIRRFEDRGIPVVVEENATRTVRLQVIGR